MKGAFEMKLNWKWATGIVLILAVLFALQFAWQLWMLYSGYGMMGGYSPRMPMMSYSYRMTPFHRVLPFGMIFMWLVPFVELILLGLGIVWLVKQLTSKSE